ncbi:sperm-specific sodium:proton exchanger-like [Amblyomma americanum]
MWFTVAIRVGLAVLVNQKRYQGWTHDKPKLFLENGIMPSLYYAIDFALDEAVLDVILTQTRSPVPKITGTLHRPRIHTQHCAELFLPGTP